MSRLYFQTRHGTAELRGSERAWLGHLARRQAAIAWDLDVGVATERVEQLLNWVVPAERQHVHELLREWREVNESDRPGAGRDAGELWRRLLSSLRVWLDVYGYELNVADRQLWTLDVGYNAALVTGSRPIQLAAKLNAYCEVHAYVEDPHRAWLADVIDEGLRTGVYRRTLRYHVAPTEPPAEEDQGWTDVVALLRVADDQPVVTSYSVTDWFPNPTVADWTPRGSDVDGDSEGTWNGWSALTDDERWDLGLAGVRRRPWLELTPESLGGAFFGPAITPYDLWAPDVEKRVRRACAFPQVTPSW